MRKREVNSGLKFLVAMSSSLTFKIEIKKYSRYLFVVSAVNLSGYNVCTNIFILSKNLLYMKIKKILSGCGGKSL